MSHLLQTDTRCELLSAAWKPHQGRVRLTSPRTLECARAHAQAFKTFDTDKSGEVDVSEFERAMRALGLRLASKAEYWQLFDTYDVDQSGFINLVRMHRESLCSETKRMKDL